MHTSFTERVATRFVPAYFFTTAALIIFQSIAEKAPLVRDLFHALAYIFPFDGESVLSAVALAFLGHAIARRKRIGLIAGLVYFGLGVAALVILLVTLATQMDPELTTELGQPLAQFIVPGLVMVVLAVCLIASRKYFTAPLAEKAFRRTVVVLLGGLALTWLLSTLVEFVVRLVGPQSVEVGSWVRHGFSDSSLTSPWTQATTVVGLFVTVVLALLMLSRSNGSTEFVSLEDELRLRSLLAKGGDSAEADSLGYFATRRDKGVVFSPDGLAAVAFRSEMGTCLASGDPVGPKDHWDGAVRAFVEYASKHGEAPAVVGTTEQGAAAYVRAGLKARPIGDEAVIVVDRFDLDSPQLRRVRASVTRARKAGYEVRVRRHRDIDPQELAKLVALADQWRQHGDDRGFSMALNRLEDPLDGQCLMVEAVDAEGVTRGVLSFVPWGRDGLSLDVMRRDPENAINGVTEVMVAGLVAQCREIGVQRISLNFAVLRAVIAAGESVGASFVQRVNRWFVSAASRRFQIEQLYRSNAKYDPEWVPRFVCWRDTSDLASVGLAIGIAEGQINVPLVGKPPQDQQLYPADDPRIVEFLEQSRPQVPARRIPDQVRHRMAVREDIIAAGDEAYPASFEREVTVSGAVQLPDGQVSSTAGRVVGIRDFGGVVFIDVADWDCQVQVICERDTLGADAIRSLRGRISRGDQIGVTGRMGASRTGTRSFIADEVVLTAKCVRPLPDIRHGQLGEETKVRQRYLDLIANEDARARVVARSAVIQSLRTTLLSESFLEVETPLLQTIHGGANARPFRTHINAYNLDLYLRIAPELYLKRLMVGGVDRVFEIGRNFRNEGADATHNPEFTMLEAYQAYGDYTSMRELTRQLIINAAIAANGHARITGTGPDGTTHEVDLEQPWRVVTVHEGIAEAAGRPVTPDTPIEELRAIAAEFGVPLAPTATRGAIIIELHEHLAECNAIAPTFFIDFPTEVSPLTRQHRTDARVAEKWDLICFGAEIATAYSELVDPVIQRQRLEEQSLLAAGGDPEAMEVDEDFLTALEYAMPPSGGMGMGVDRLVMLLTGKNIRETIIFPLVKPQR